MLATEASAEAARGPAALPEQGAVQSEPFECLACCAVLPETKSSVQDVV